MKLQTVHNKSSKRQRIPTNRFHSEFLENEERLMIQHALKISKLDTKRVEADIPDAPVFHPTMEEFLDPMQYITKIRDQVTPYGICKIVPPPEWQPPCQVDLDSPMRFPTKKQQIDTLTQGQGFDDGKMYNIREYKAMAEAFYQSWCAQHHPAAAEETATGTGKRVTQEALAKDYWDIVETNSRAVAVEYGNDLDTVKFTSGFPRNGHFAIPMIPKVKEEEIKSTSPQVKKENKATESVFDEKFYAGTGWNLNNIATSKGSLLQYLRTPINGINVPWLYVGMLFASFCWHNEDNYFYSISYNHFGATKQWYGVPGDSAAQFEKVSKDFLLGLFRESPDLLHHMTTQVSPSILKANGVPVYKMTQEERTFMVTFPKAFHAGFSYGFNCGEAVNFACSDWLVAGGHAEERYRGFGRESVFSHQRLLFTLLHHRADLEHKCLKDLAAEVLRVVNEEIYSRPQIYKQGVRDLRDKITLPNNNFDSIDDQAAAFDDMRQCYGCKAICVFSAVACECDQTRVACMRHFPTMCKCPAQRKFMLEWASAEQLVEFKNKALKLLDKK